MDGQDDLVIVGPDGTEYAFPAGTDERVAIGHVQRIIKASQAPKAEPSMGQAVRSAVGAVFPMLGPAPSREQAQQLGQDQKGLAVGAAKGFASTVTRGGDWLREKLPFLTKFDVDTGGSREALKPANAAERVGFAGEQIAENVIPAARAARGVAALTKGAPGVVRLGAQMATGAATNAAAGAAHGHTADEIKSDALIGAAGPAVGGAVSGAANYVGSRAVPWVRSAIKTPMSVLKKQPGFGKEGVDAVDTRLAKTIIDEGLFDDAVATGKIDESMKQVDNLVAKNAAKTTDSGTRAQRYLRTLKGSAGKQRLAGSDLKNVQDAEAELARGSLGEDVIAPAPHPSLVGPNGKPLMVPTVVGRQIKPTSTVGESRDAALAAAKWSRKPAQWGGTQDVRTEAGKAIERADRDAVKAAVPETKPHLARASRMIKAREPLRLMQKRDASRDVMSLNEAAGAITTAATGHPAPALMGFAQRWFKNNQLAAGIYAGRLQKALDTGDVVEVGRILQKIGVAVPTELGGQE